MSNSRSIVPAKRRVRRKRHVPEPTPVPPPVAVTVVSVTRIDDQVALWAFSDVAVSVEDGGGLVVGGQEPDGVLSVTAEGISMQYSSGVNVDDPWSIDPFPVAAITFANGGMLVVPESGNVV